jgi:hypothetical protein
MNAEARVVVAAGMLCLIAGCAWLWGGIGLLAVGVILAASGLFLIDVEGGDRAEPMGSASRRARR